MQLMVVFGHDAAVYGLGDKRVNEMNIGRNHAAVAGSLARFLDLKSSALPLQYDCLPPFYYGYESKYRIIVVMSRSSLRKVTSQEIMHFLQFIYI